VEEEGRVYPYSEQASAVCEALLNELVDRKVEILCGTEVQTAEKRDSGFVIKAAAGKEFRSDALILATGGKAGPQYGSTGDGYRIAKAFGHNVVRLMPSLVQMASHASFFKTLKGVRAKGEAELLRDGLAVDSEIGEIQFTEDGLSGICIFNLSKEYVRGDMIKIDLFPKYGEEKLEDILTGRIKTLGNRRMPDFFSGILHKKLIPVLLAELVLEEDKKAAELKQEEIKKIVKLMKGWTISITGTKGWKEAQVTAGGVDLAEIDPDTMESKLASGLYFAGELLNVDGKCGGYNLQWAWTSGMAAGKSAAASQG
jgi:predicted Rossmann fold flavoprotein